MGQEHDERGGSDRTQPVVSKRMTDEQRRQRIIGRLEAGAEHAACGEHIAAMDALRRAELYNTLAFERLERKNRDINDIHRSTGENWNQTFYIMLLRTIGGMDNRRPFRGSWPGVRHMPRYCANATRCTRSRRCCSGHLDCSTSIATTNIPLRSNANTTTCATNTPSRRSMPRRGTSRGYIPTTTLRSDWRR